MRVILSFTVLLLTLVTGFSQVDNDKKVMLIGEDDSYYEELVGECNTLLLSVTNNSMEKAFNSWSDMLEDMETAAVDEGFDIKGIKLWVNLFWNEDGSIRKIYYYPKPTSKNMDFDRLTSFLTGFSASYIFPLSSDDCFSHYGSASFPVRTRVRIEEK